MESKSKSESTSEFPYNDSNIIYNSSPSVTVSPLVTEGLDPNLTTVPLTPKEEEEAEEGADARKQVLEAFARQKATELVRQAPAQNDQDELSTEKNWLTKLREFLPKYDSPITATALGVVNAFAPPVGATITARTNEKRTSALEAWLLWGVTGGFAGRAIHEHLYEVTQSGSLNFFGADNHKFLDFLRDNKAASWLSDNLHIPDPLLCYLGILGLVLASRFVIDEFLAHKIKMGSKTRNTTYGFVHSILGHEATDKILCPADALRLLSDQDDEIRSDITSTSRHPDEGQGNADTRSVRTGGSGGTNRIDRVGTKLTSQDRTQRIQSKLTKDVEDNGLKEVFDPHVASLVGADPNNLSTDLEIFSAALRFADQEVRESQKQDDIEEHIARVQALILPEAKERHQKDLKILADQQVQIIITTAPTKEMPDQQIAILAYNNAVAAYYHVGQSTTTGRRSTSPETDSDEESTQHQGRQNGY